MEASVVVVEGQRIALTNLDKVLYPASGTTKGEVISYYAEVAAVMLPHLRQRPITRKRYPEGVGNDGEAPSVFFAKNLPKGTPEWVRRYGIEHSSGTNEYPVADDVATLTWLAQLAALELHVPQWRFAEDGSPLPPDRLVFDLDPGEGIGLAECAEVANWIREIMDGAGLPTLPVTSGSKGLHLYAKLDGDLDSTAVIALAKEVAEALQSRHPELVTAVMRRSERAGRVFLDWSQNNGSKTTVAAYSLRGRSRPWVAAPRTWAELGAADLRQLEFDEVLNRVAEFGDLLAPLAPETSGSDSDRLHRYRSMRDASNTPEPVPATAPPPTSGNSFVIQEHHARRLHWDFRLERDGVLVSWAVPKGPPTDPGKNHLAVHVEDHPLAYGGFEGAIPAGQYGAGSVSIWDAGDYVVDKWREGKEVIITLHGRTEGGLGGEPAKFALIHTGDKNWLIHRMRLSPGRPAEKVATNSTSPLSPASQRDAVSVGATDRDRSLTVAMAPMLATLASPDTLGDDAGWDFEMKWDGVRAIITIDPGRVRITSRNGRDETFRYPDLTGELLALGCRSAVLDGEIVALDEGGAPDFGLLQPRINLTRPTEIAAAAAAVPAQLILFDLLELDGISLLDVPYEQRRDLLTRLVPSSPRVQVPPAFEGDLASALAASQAHRLEGVVAKRKGSSYQPGRRSAAWLKIKHRRTQSVLIGGWRPGEGNRASTIGSLLMGLPTSGGLRYLGRVGSGFTDIGLREAEALLEPLADVCQFVDVPAPDARGARWVRPELVGEVQFASVSSGGRLRHPVWLGWRSDLRAGNVGPEWPPA